MLTHCLSYSKTSANFMPLCLTLLVIIPSYTENYGYKSAFLTISMSYCLSELQRAGNKEDINQTWSIGSWLKLLCLIARLGLSCSCLGHLLTSYHGSENISYHLFPQIPWMMPVTIPFTLTLFISFGLQPSSVIKMIFDLAFGILFITFFTLGTFVVLYESNNLSLELSGINEVPGGMLFFFSQFFIHVDGKKMIKNKTCLSLKFCLLSMAILAFLNQKLKCNGIGNCLKYYYTWCEPLILALSVSCLGLCLVDFFVAASEHLKTLPEFKELHAVVFKNAIHRSTFIVGVVCMSLTFFYSTAMLIIICNSSIVIASSLECLENLYFLTTLSGSSSENKTSNNDYSKLNQNDSFESDRDSCSDIDTIVEEYKSQIQVMSGLDLITETYFKRASYIFKLILTTITVCCVLISLAYQTKLYKFGISMGAVTIILMLLLQWASNSLNSMLVKPKPSLYFPIMKYVITTFLIGFIPSSVWLCIIMWTIIGGMLKITIMVVKRFGRRKEFKQFFSIRESPPDFGISCVTSHVEQKSKIIHA